MEKIIADLKDFPITQDEILALKTSISDGTSSINYDIYDGSPSANGKSKASYSFTFSIYKKSGKQPSAFTPGSKSQIYLYLIDTKGKITVKKKLKTRTYIKKGLKGRLKAGTYLAITWCDIEEDKRVGKIYFISK